MITPCTILLKSNRHGWMQTSTSELYTVAPKFLVIFFSGELSVNILRRKGEKITKMLQK